MATRSTSKKSKRSRPPTIADLSREMVFREAERAIVFDYEGRKKGRPDFIGVFDPSRPDSTFRQVVLADDLAPAARAGTGHEVEDMASFMAGLVAQARANDALLVSYSEHERRMMERWIAPDHPRLYAEFLSVYRDARALGKRWANASGFATEVKIDGRFRLRWFMSHLGFTCCKSYREAEVSRTIATLRKHFAAGRSYRRLSAKRKTAWHDALGHNRCDVLATRELVLAGTRALEAWR
jgi:hypothetical protein